MSRAGSERGRGQLRIVHVLPRDLARGAQVVAKSLRDQLDGPQAQHRTVTLFRSEAAALDPDYRLDLPPGALRRLGFEPRVVPRLRRLLNDLEPDVVVAHGGEPLKYCVAASPRRCRLVAYKIGTSSDALQGRLQKGLHSRLMHRADRVVAVSDDVAEEATQFFGCAPARVSVIPNGRDPERYRPQELAANDESKPVRLAYLGHLTRTKRPSWFVEVIRRLADDHPQLSAVMIGDGPLLDEVRRDAADLPIEVLGRRDDVPELLRQADALVFPSLPEGEGMPGVFIEAGLTGIPVIATDVAGASTVIDDGTTGYIVPSDNHDLLTKRAGEVVADPELRRRLGQAARQRCEARFSMDAVTQAWSDLLADVAST